MPHEQARGLSMKWEEKVARLPLPPLAHREWTAASASEALLVWRPRVSFYYEDPWFLFYCLRPLVSVLGHSISGG